MRAQRVPPWHEAAHAALFAAAPRPPARRHVEVAQHDVAPRARPRQRDASAHASGVAVATPSAACAARGGGIIAGAGAGARACVCCLGRALFICARWSPVFLLRAPSRERAFSPRAEEFAPPHTATHPRARGRTCRPTPRRSTGRAPSTSASAGGRRRAVRVGVVATPTRDEIERLCAVLVGWFRGARRPRRPARRAHLRAGRGGAARPPLDPLVVSTPSSTARPSTAGAGTRAGGARTTSRAPRATSSSRSAPQNPRHRRGGATTRPASAPGARLRCRGRRGSAGEREGAPASRGAEGERRRRARRRWRRATPYRSVQWSDARDRARGELVVRDDRRRRARHCGATSIVAERRAGARVAAHVEVGRRGLRRELRRDVDEQPLDLGRRARRRLVPPPGRPRAHVRHRAGRRPSAKHLDRRVRRVRCAAPAGPPRCRAARGRRRRSRRPPRGAARAGARGAR